MSEIFVDTIRKTGGSLGTDIRVKNTSVYESEGGTSVTQNLVQGSVKEWNLFDQRGSVHGANTLGDSFNVSSASDVSTGHYDVSFTNNMNNTAYCPVSNVHYTGLLANDQYSRFSAPSNLATSSYRIAGQYANASSEDGYFTVGTTGDLA